MKFLSGIVGFLANLVYVVILAALLVAAPILFGNRPVVILSGSMEPAYPVGSIIYYKATPFDQIEVGDAITFRIGEESFATHRVVEKDAAAQSFRTKGDANDSADAEAVAYTRVVGRASDFAIPYAGYFTQYMRNWRVFSVMGAILVADVVLGILTDRKRDAQRARKKSRAGKRSGGESRAIAETAVQEVACAAAPGMAAPRRISAGTRAQERPPAEPYLRITRVQPDNCPQDAGAGETPGKAQKDITAADFFKDF